MLEAAPAAGGGGADAADAADAAAATDAAAESVRRSLTVGALPEAAETEADYYVYYEGDGEQVAVSPHLLAISSHLLLHLLLSGPDLAATARPSRRRA